MTEHLRRAARALISVSDKTGVIEFARALAGYGIELISTGGTRKALSDAGLNVLDIADITGFPEMMDGRVKTLHPAVHGALLAIRANATHAEAMRAHKISPIDLIVVNLYPFEQTVARGADFADCIENIDIGGPAMIRSAAKNHGDVVVLVEPDGARTMFTDRGAGSGLRSHDLSPALLEDVSWLHLSAYSLLSYPSRQACRQLFDAAGNAGLGRSVDPNSVSALVEMGGDTFLEWTSGADVLFPNLAEAQALAGCEEPGDAAERLLERYPIVAVKLAHDGVLVASREGLRLRRSAPEGPVVDPTGAGDAFAAGFLAAIASGEDVTAATRSGLEAAARAIRQIGAWPHV